MLIEVVSILPFFAVIFLCYCCGGVVCVWVMTSIVSSGMLSQDLGEQGYCSKLTCYVIGALFPLVCLIPGLVLRRLTGKQNLNAGIALLWAMSVFLISYVVLVNVAYSLVGQISLRLCLGWWATAAGLLNYGVLTSGFSRPLRRATGDQGDPVHSKSSETQFAFYSRQKTGYTRVEYFPQTGRAVLSRRNRATRPWVISSERIWQSDMLLRDAGKQADDWMAEN